MYFMAAALVTTMGVSGLTGCQSKGGEKDTVAQDSQTVMTEQKPEAEQTAHVVTFYDADGKTVLETKEVEDGACAEEYVPEKEGYTFAGWFATPQMSHKFDFTTAITADTDIFAGFVSYQEDTRKFAIVGSGTSPVLLESNWGAVIGDAQTLTKEVDPDANVYTITLDLEAGDEFQFAITLTGMTREAVVTLLPFQKMEKIIFKIQEALEMRVQRELTLSVLCLEIIPLP